MTAPLGKTGGCPRHKHNAFCPLFAAAHEPGNPFGCVDDLARPCRVRRGLLNYGRAVEGLKALSEEWRRAVAIDAWNEEAHEFREALARGFNA